MGSDLVLIQHSYIHLFTLDSYSFSRNSSSTGSTQKATKCPTASWRLSRIFLEFHNHLTSFAKDHHKCPLIEPAVLKKQQSSSNFLLQTYIDKKDQFASSRLVWTKQYYLDIKQYRTSELSASHFVLLLRLFVHL